MKFKIRLPFTGETVEVRFLKINLIPIVLLVIAQVVPPSKDSLWHILQTAWFGWIALITRPFGYYSWEATGIALGLILIVDWSYQTITRRLSAPASVRPIMRPEAPALSAKK